MSAKSPRFCRFSSLVEKACRGTGPGPCIMMARRRKGPPGLRLPRAGRRAKRAARRAPRRGPRLWSLEGLVFKKFFFRHKKIHGTQVSFGPEAHLYQELNSRLPFLSLVYSWPTETRRKGPFFVQIRWQSKLSESQVDQTEAFVQRKSKSCVCWGGGGFEHGCATPPVLTGAPRRMDRKRARDKSTQEGGVRAAAR